MFAKGSRYEKVGDAEYTDANGRVVKYKKVRVIKTPDAPLAHVVNGGERLDHIAFRYYKDPERFWRVADANEVLWAGDLVEEPGRRIKIPLSVSR